MATCLALLGGTAPGLENDHKEGLVSFEEDLPSPRWEAGRWRYMGTGIPTPVASCDDTWPSPPPKKGLSMAGAYSNSCFVSLG